MDKTGVAAVQGCRSGETPHASMIWIGSRGVQRCCGMPQGFSQPRAVQLWVDTAGHPCFVRKLQLQHREDNCSANI